MSRLDTRIFVPHAAALVLVAAGLLKAADWAHGIPARGSFAVLPGTLQPLLVGAQLTLGLWLFSWRGRRVANAIAGLLFLAMIPFAAASWLRADNSCGCFGAVAIPPAVSLLLDICFAITLLPAALARVSSTPPQAGGRWRVHEVCASAALGATVVWTVWVIPQAVRAGFVETRQTQLLDPEKWVGQQFSLPTALNGKINEGDWTVLLHRPGCPACRQAIDRLSRTSQRVALIAVPDDSAAAHVPLNFPRRWLRTELDSGVRWIVETPVLMELRNGRVHAVRHSDRIEFTL